MRIIIDRPMQGYYVAAELGAYAASPVSREQVIELRNALNVFLGEE